MERGQFLISPDWQTHVVARTSGLLRGPWFGYFDARVRTARRDLPSARATPAQPTRPDR